LNFVTLRCGILTVTLRARFRARLFYQAPTSSGTSIPRFVTKKKQPARQRAIPEIPIVPIVKPKFLPDRRYLRPTIHGIMAR